MAQNWKARSKSTVKSAMTPRRTSRLGERRSKKKRNGFLDEKKKPIRTRGKEVNFKGTNHRARVTFE